MYTKIQSFLNSLNGWQRIYVSIVVLVITPLAIYEAKTTIQHRVSDVTFFKSMPIELKNYLKEKKIEFSPKVIVLSQSSNSIDWSRVPTEDPPTNLEVGWTIPYDGGDFHMKLPKDLDEITINQVGHKVQIFLDSEAAKIYWTYVLKSIVLERLMLTIAVLFAGYAFAWIYRGFLKK